MFTGIIEAAGTIIRMEKSGTNTRYAVEAPFLKELQIDQSIAHDGVCLTVDSLGDNFYTVTAIQETLDKTQLQQWKPGTRVNLERCLKAGGRLDGHFVQGHVDTVARVQSIVDKDGSWEVTFSYSHNDFFTVEKGSIAVNGVSLTVVRSEPGIFSVAIIPYTWEHTNFSDFKPDSLVNIEFDILGKYITTYLGRQKNGFM